MLDKCPEVSTQIRYQRQAVAEAPSHAARHRAEAKDLRGLGELAAEAAAGIESGLGLHLGIERLVEIMDIGTEVVAVKRYHRAQETVDKIADSLTSSAKRVKSDAKTSKAWLAENDPEAAAGQSS